MSSAFRIRHYHCDTFYCMISFQYVYKWFKSGSKSKKYCSVPLGPIQLKITAFVLLQAQLFNIGSIRKKINSRSMQSVEEISKHGDVEKGKNNIPNTPK